LHVRSAIATGGGLRVRFSAPLDVLRLVRGTPSGEPLRATDVLVLRNGAPVRGHVVIDPDGAGFLFVPEGGALRDGNYELTLSTANGSFITLDGRVLDGDHDGRAGGDYKARLLVQRPVQSSAAEPAADGLSTALPVATAAADHSWSLLQGLGGIGGAAMLMTALVPAGLPVPRRRHARKLAEAATVTAPVKLRMQPGRADVMADASATAPAWVDRWLGKETDAASANRWSIRL
jgi:hypothetical protein